MNKHYDLLKETVTPQSFHQEVKEVPETPKSIMTREDLETEESKTVPVVKHKMMSLLTLVKEFSQDRKSKSKN